METETSTRILVVEDEAIIAADLSRRLERLGHSVVGVADTGATAMELAVNARPELILMDIIIQGPVDGIETASAIAQRIDVPIVFLTAHSDAATLERAKRVAPYGYLVKPFDVRELQRTIDMTLYRHASDARARLLLQAMAHATTGMAIVDARDPERRFILCNRAMERISGYSSTELLEQRPCFLAGPESDPAVIAEFRGAIAEAREFRATVRAHRKDGAAFWDEITISPVRSPVGEPTHLLLFHDDVTERKQTEQALLQAQKMEAVGRLTGGVAHDFNNILSVILSFASFVRDDLEEGDQRREDIVEVLRAAEKAVGLTRQLLTFSRHHPPAKRPIDLNESAANLLKLLRRSVGEGVNLEIVPSARPAVVRMDPVQFDQILLNLSVNARDAMEEGGRLRLSISHPSEPTERFGGGRYVRVDAEDTGHGMDAATAARIFEPFFTTKPVGRGTGLGLATCFAIVHDTGGTIAVDSAPGRGTKFTIDLPLCDEPLEDVDDDRADRRGAGERVLLTEDDGALRRAVARILESSGYRVVQARDGEEAIERLSEGPDEVDLLLSDVVLPGRSGHAVVDHARRLRPGLPVLLTTGYLDERERGPTHEHLPVLWKPFSRAALLRSIERALAAARQASAPDPAASPPAAEGAPKRPSSRVPGQTILLFDREEGPGEAQAATLREAGFGVSVAQSLEALAVLLERRAYGAVVAFVRGSAREAARLVRAARSRDPNLAVLLVGLGPREILGLSGSAVEHLDEPDSPELLVRAVERTVDAGERMRLRAKLHRARSGDTLALDLAELRPRFEAALASVEVALGPVVRAHGGAVFGYDATLAVRDSALASIDELGTASVALGRGDELEHAKRRAIVNALRDEALGDTAIFVELRSPELSVGPLLDASNPLAPHAARVVLVVPEHEFTARLIPDVRDLRAAGYRFAIHELGTREVPLGGLEALRPDFARLDGDLVREVHRRPERRGLIGALVARFRRAGTSVVADGVEGSPDALALSDLGVDLLSGPFAVA